MNNRKTVIVMLSVALVAVTLTLYTANLGTQQFTGYVVNTRYVTYPYNRTYITLSYGHPNTMSYAKFTTFSVYGYHEFEYGGLYRITTHSTITQVLKHMVSVELLNQTK